MNFLLQQILLLIVVLALPVAGWANEAEIPDISIEDLAEKLGQKQVIIVDVNGSRYFAKGHIPNAIDYHVHKEDLTGALGDDLSALIVVYCGGPYCSAYEAPANQIRELGFTNVKHLSAGISGWIGAGMETGRTDR